MYFKQLRIGDISHATGHSWALPANAITVNVLER